MNKSTKRLIISVRYKNVTEICPEESKKFACKKRITCMLMMISCLQIQRINFGMNFTILTVNYCFHSSHVDACDSRQLGFQPL